MFIQFGIITYKNIIQLLYPLFYHLRFRIGGGRENCFELFLTFSSYSLAGVIYLIVKYRSKETKRENKENKSSDYGDERPSIGDFDDLHNDVIIKEIEKMKKEEEKSQLLKLKLTVTGLAILNFLSMFSEAIILNIESLKLDANIKESSTIFFGIIFYVLLSRIFLHQKVYNHQLFSLLVILFSMTFVFFIYLIEKKLAYSNALGTIAFFALIFFFYGLYNTLGKRTLNHFIISPYYLMFSIGFISLITLIIYEIITCLFLGINSEYNGIIRQIKKDFSIMFILLSVFSTIMGLFWVGGIWLTIYYFSPCHFIINEVLTQFVTNLLDKRFNDYEPTKKIICYVAYVIIFVCTLIYNEVIIININCLSKDTRKNIIKRQYVEIDSIMYDNIDPTL